MTADIQTGLVSVTYRQLPPEEIIRLTAEAGLSCIEWGSDVHVPQSDLNNACRTGEMTRAAGLTVSSYGAYYRLGAGQDFVPYLAAARALGAPLLRLWAGTKPSAAVSSEERKNIVAEARRIADMACDAGLEVAFEYHPGTLTDNRTSAVALVQEVDHPACALYWQPDFRKPTHELTRGLRQVLPWLRAIHVFQWMPDSRRLPLSEGKDTWCAFLDCIPDLARHPLLLEFVPDDRPELLSREAASLHHIISEVSV